MKATLYFFNTLLILILINLLFCQQAFAVTASPYPFDYNQPDGSVVKIKMMGDEWVRWAETLDNYTLLRNSDGAWEYATTDGKGDIVPSGSLASNVEDRSDEELAFLNRTEKSLSFSDDQISFLRSIRAQQNERGITGFPTTGTINALVILMAYSDVPFTKSQTDFDNLMNQVNYNGTGSFGEFYYENSYGQLTINTTVAGPYTADYGMAWYGTNTPSDDYRVRDLITEAVIAADVAVNYADFDNDNDGYVDGIYVIYAGYGEEAGGGTDAIWAHAWSIVPQYLDGKWVSKYACSAELRGSSGADITGIGVICHEFGHNLGAPDYYDVDYGTNGSYDGTGRWDMMAGGSWNGNGDVPAHHNAFTKFKYYNWLTPTVISSAQEVDLRDISIYPDVVRINTTTSNEYFLCENRQLTNFNASLPGHGMIIYHVDEDYIDAQYPYNTINNDAHQGMYPMSAISTTANGIMPSSESTINTAGCPWPGTSNKTVFNDATTPWSKSWLGNPTGTPVLSIQENFGNIVFCLNACDANKPGSLSVVPASTSLINLSWTQNTSSDPVLIAYNTVNSFGIPIDGNAYSAGNSISGGGTVLYNGTNLATAHSGLIPGANFYYKAWSVQVGNLYSAGIINRGNTFYILPYSEDFTTAPDDWTQVENAGATPGQIWQFGTTTFGTTVPGLTGNYAYLNSDRYGSGNTQDVDLITPTLDLADFTSVSLQFKHYFRQYSASTATLSYSTNNGISWTQIPPTWNTTSTNNPETFSQVIATVAGYPQVKFKWTYVGTYEYGWAIDDISITGTHGPTWTGANSSDWNLASNWVGLSVPTSLNNVIIPATGTNPVIQTTSASCNNLTIEAGAVLTINPGKALTVNGALINSAGTSGLLIKSDATGTGTLLHGTADVAASVERYVAKYNAVDDQMYHFISSPVEAQAIQPAFVADPPTADFDFMAWDEPGYQWLNSKTANDLWNDAFEDNFVVGKGYLVAWPNNETKTFSGDLNSFPDAIPLVITCTNTNSGGWNLLGNPFPSAIDWDLVDKGDGMDDALYYYDNANENYKYYIQLGSFGVGGGSQYIPPMQGFMVHAKTTGTKTLSLDDTQRTHQSSELFYKTDIPNLFTFQLEGSAKTDEAVIFFHTSATAGFDSHADAYKLLSSSAVMPQIYSLTSSEIKLSINTLPDLSLNPDVPIGIRVPATGSYKLKAIGIETFSASTEIFLHDNLTGADHSLNVNSEYPFETNISGEINDRFEIRFKGETAINNPSGDITVYYNQGYIRIIIPEEMKGQVSINNLLGQTILNKTMTFQKETVIIVQSLKPGSYFVRVSDGKKIMNKKFIVL